MLLISFKKKKKEENKYSFERERFRGIDDRSIDRSIDCIENIEITAESVTFTEHVRYANNEKNYRERSESLGRGHCQKWNRWLSPARINIGPWIEVAALRRSLSISARIDRFTRILSKKKRKEKQNYKSPENFSFEKHP